MTFNIASYKTTGFTASSNYKYKPKAGLKRTACLRKKNNCNLERITSAIGLLQCILKSGLIKKNRKKHS